MRVEIWFDKTQDFGLNID